MCLPNSRISEMVFLDALWSKVLCCGYVYDEAQLKSLFIERLQPSFHHSMQEYLGIGKKPSMQELARFADSHCRLQVKMAYTEDVDRQRQRGRGNREMTLSVLSLQSSGALSSRKSLETSCRTATRQTIAVGSGVGPSYRVHKTETGSLTTKADDASFYYVQL